MVKFIACSFLALALVAVVGPAQAQLIAVDNTYGVPYKASLVVEAPGLLENDTFNGDPVTDHGATAALLVYPNHGFLNCDANPTFDLCPDGSFTYTPDSSFPGFDSFVYQVDVGGELGEATVTLNACTGGPARFVCWHETPYLAKLGQLGYSTFQEGFEGSADWGALRSPATAPFVIHAGLKWESNHPAPPASNELTTGPGPARTGSWGLYDPDHGYVSGTPAECDVSSPPPGCLFHDGFTGIREAGGTRLYGVGGHFTGVSQPNLKMILDGGAPIGLGRVIVGSQFFGVIDTAGFTSFRLEESDGKAGQVRLVFGDDFTFGTTPSDTTPPVVGKIDSVPDTGDHQLTEGEATPVAITQLLVSYGELVRDLGETAVDSVTNPANYLLFSDGGNGFDTVNCAAGVAPGDVPISTGPVTYISGSDLIATLGVNDGLGLLPGSYRLLVCGTTSIRDWAGNAMDGNGNGTGGDDFRRNFTVTGNTAPGDVLNSLRLGKSTVTPGRIRLNWSASCSAAASDYAIYRGTIGSYYSHTSVACTDVGGDRVEEITPQAASSYYLVVPLSATAEGSYGRASNGSERPMASPLGRCHSSQVMGGCP